MVIVNKPKQKVIKTTYFKKINKRYLPSEKYNIEKINKMNTFISNFNEKIDILYNTIKNNSIKKSELPFIVYGKIVELFKKELDFIINNIPKIIKGEMKLHNYINHSLLFLWCHINNNNVFNNFMNNLGPSMFMLLYSNIKSKEIIYYELSSILGSMILNHYYGLIVL